jgi:hypothetical protein
MLLAQITSTSNDPLPCPSIPACPGVARSLLEIRFVQQPTSKFSSRLRTITEKEPSLSTEIFLLNMNVLNLGLSFKILNYPPYSRAIYIQVYIYIYIY